MEGLRRGSKPTWDSSFGGYLRGKQANVQSDSDSDSDSDESCLSELMQHRRMCCQSCWRTVLQIVRWGRTSHTGKRGWLHVLKRVPLRYDIGLSGLLLSAGRRSESWLMWSGSYTKTCSREARRTQLRNQLVPTRYTLGCTGYTRGVVTTWLKVT